MPFFQLSDEILFPDVSLAEEDGLLAIGGDLGIERLLKAYSSGIFPWYSEEQPIFWWSPDPRLILIPEKFVISHSLQQKLKKEVFTVKFDTRFARVMDMCASADDRAREGTWITRDMKRAYVALHRVGYAHSVETFYNGKLVGGLYGVSLGSAFFGESMFHIMTDASKVALFYLVQRLKEYKFILIDSQVETSHMVSLGAELIPRRKYLASLKKALKHPTYRGKWQALGPLIKGSKS
jgi:leucyl/phenylalanyl-tRNA---protein transferase